ncbi:MAG TPA: hypothetical protein VKU41_33100 [Polyangiaceae bacterium]|nr:hypothetical protein [Polyangiaceae bacterium]
MFNEDLIHEREMARELHLDIKEDGHPSPPLADEPDCTRSLIVVYLDSRKRFVARAHLYVRPDQHIGASGRPDPKELRRGDKIYVP